MFCARTCIHVGAWSIPYYGHKGCGSVSNVIIQGQLDEASGKCVELEGKVERQSLTIQELQSALQNQSGPSISRSQPTYGSTTDLDTIKKQLVNEFSPNFGREARVPRLDTLVDQLKQVVDVHRNVTLPQKTPFQHWAQQACDIIGTANANQQPHSEFGCYDASCNWKHKKTTLNAYILHLERHHGQKMRRKPDLNLLPTV